MLTVTKFAKVQEGEKPPENPTELLSELDRLLGDLNTIVKNVNKMNSVVEFGDGKTLTEALADRDNIALKQLLEISVFNLCWNNYIFLKVKEGIGWILSMFQI